MRMSGLFLSLVADTYTSAWSGVLPLIDENNFLETMATAYTRVYINISHDLMIDKLRDTKTNEEFFQAMKKR